MKWERDSNFTSDFAVCLKRQITPNVALLKRVCEPTYEYALRTKRWYTRALWRRPAYRKTFINEFGIVVGVSKRHAPLAIQIDMHFFKFALLLWFVRRSNK